jgi:thiol:disulfide interchange protein DsbC
VDSKSFSAGTVDGVIKIGGENEKIERMTLQFCASGGSMKPFFFRFFSIALLLVAGETGALAFMKEGCGSGECRDCHRLTREEAGKLLGGMVDNVLNVEESPVGGLWVVDLVKAGRKIPVYIDFSKKYLLGAQIIRLSTKEDITGARMMKLNEVKVDTSQIPLGDALVMGNPAAKRKVIVFSDPDCHFCGKLHGELKTVTEKEPDVAFYIKLYARSNNPATAEKAKSVICAKSLALLEDAYAGKPLPPAICTTGAPEETLKLADRLHLQGTPTLILPDGRVLPGYRDAKALMQLLAGPQPPTGNGAKGKGR